MSAEAAAATASAGYSPIVVAIDDSVHSKQAFEFYLKRIHRPGYEVVFAHCVEPPLKLIVLDGHAGLVARAAGMHKALLEKCWQEVGELEKKFVAYIECMEQNAHVKYRMHAVEGGNPGEAIVGIAEEEKATMLVMGSRGLGFVMRTILGSVSDYVFHHAKCPVLICQKMDTIESTNRGVTL